MGLSFVKKQNITAFVVGQVGNLRADWHWRAIYDDKGRILVAISFNSDIGDAWEWADDPYYPAKFSDQAIRMGVNYIVYAMTH